MDISSKGEISGIANKYYVCDSYNDCLVDGCFAADIKRGHYMKNGKVPMLINHDAKALPVGSWHKTYERAGVGLIVEGQLNLNTSGGREAFELIKAGDLPALSIGWSPDREAGVEPFLKDPKKGVRFVQAARLFEVSLVMLPANIESVITSVKHGHRYDKELSDQELKCVLETLLAGFEKVNRNFY